MKVIPGLRAGLPSLVTYLVLPLLGWWLGGGVLWPIQNIDLLPSFLAEPSRIAYVAAVVCQVGAIGFLAGRLPHTLPAYPAQPGAVYWRNIALETIMMLAPYCDHRAILVFQDTPGLRWAGMLSFILGTSLVLWSSFLHSRAAAQRDLAPYDPVLVMEGPFRRLRFPGYLGLLVLSLGASLLFRSWLGLGALAFMLNFVVMRIHEEDKVARLKYGIQWTAYSHHSWRLLPFIF
jgi:protein-S-isoprenylcysteine O-methyltransferase Ste14